MTDELLKNILLNQILILSAVAQLVAQLPAGSITAEQIIEQIRHTQSVFDENDDA